VADHALVDGTDKRQRRKRSLRGAQRVDKRGYPFAVPECLPVNLPYGFVLLGPFVPDHQLNRSAPQAAPWIHGARLALSRPARDAINYGCDE
jgi:hypothetical protein